MIDYCKIPYITHFRVNGKGSISRITTPKEVLLWGYILNDLIPNEDAAKEKFRASTVSNNRRELDLLQHVFLGRKPIDEDAKPTFYSKWGTNAPNEESFICRADVTVGTTYMAGSQGVKYISTRVYVMAKVADRYVVTLLGNLFGEGRAKIASDCSGDYDISNDTDKPKYLPFAKASNAMECWKAITSDFLNQEDHSKKFSLYEEKDKIYLNSETLMRYTGKQ